MEFFERAHVAKSKNSSQKESKSQENVKKQLKQMLYGYKTSDNELIRNSEKIRNDLDDSTSVSGFSDLNLTCSSIEEGDAAQDTVRSDANDVTLFETNDLSLNEVTNVVNPTKHEVNISVSESIHLISECDDDINSLIDDMPPKIQKNSSSDTMDDISLSSSFIETSTDLSDDSEVFDADGALASEILKKLGDVKKVKTKKSKKRKFDQLDSNKGPKVSLKIDYSDSKTNRNSDTEQQKRDIKFRGPYRPKEVDTPDLSSEEGTAVIAEHNETEENTSLDLSELSLPFISISATEIPSQTFSDILGEYRHSTVKNLPSESQNIALNSDIFPIEEMTVDDIEIEETSSLVAETHNETYVDDIHVDSTDMDTTMPNEESTLYDTSQQTDLSEREPSTESVDTTLVNPVKVYYGKNNCIFILKHPAEIFVHGKVRIKALGGTVEVVGYTLKDEACEIYAPNYNCAYYLRSVENQNAFYGLFGKLTSAGLTVSDAEEIVTTLGEYDGVLSMSSLRSTKIDFIERSFNVTDLFSKANKNIDNCFKKASKVLDCSLYMTRPWKCFEENTSWKQAIKCGHKTKSRGIVCGGKGTGKSTFLRYYINKLLAHGPVLVLDLDPGQCEFTPAGNVSATIVTMPLLGPNFTHLKTPELMLNIGMINTMDNPRRYAAAVETLTTHCANDEQLQNMPWIVNTMGMTNAIGLKFMALIILQTNPTFLLQIDSKNAKKRFDFQLYPKTIKNLYFDSYQHDFLFRNVTHAENVDYSFFLSHHTENLVKNNLSLAPKDERYLTFLAYFGELIGGKQGLLELTPYEVNLEDLCIAGNVGIREEAVTRVINGKIISLCQHTPPAPRDRKVFTLADKPLHCHGLGLVRGIDWEKGILYVITPTTPDKLALVNTLVYADWVPELRGQEIHLPQGTAVPYRTATAYQQRQLMFTPKRRFNPLQLLKMSRNS